MTERAVGKARGVLRAPSQETLSLHERRAPDEDLAPFVEHFWTVAWDLRGPPQIREVLPHPSVHIVFERGRAQISGVPSGRFTREIAGKGFVFGIKFLPGGFRSFVDFPIVRMTGKVIDLEDVLGPTKVGARIVAARTMQSRMRIATEFLRERLPPPDPVAVEIARVVRHIQTSREVRTVSDVARLFRSSSRSIQRLFNEYVGISPKWIILRYRMHEAIERLDEGKPVSWSALAQDLGYFDQAHFIRDFKKLVGRTPGDYASAHRESRGVGSFNRARRRP